MKSDPTFLSSLEDAAEVAIRPSSLSVSPVEEKTPATGVSWLHRFAALVAVLEFLVFVFDALARSSPARYLSLDRWMTEIAAAATVALAVALLKNGYARHVKVLGLAAAFIAIAQILAQAATAAQDPSLLTVLIEAPATLLLFSVAVSLALFTRTDWRWDEPKIPDIAGPSFRQLCVFTTAALFVLTLAGSTYARGLIRLAPHLIGGIIVTGGALWMLEIAFNRFSGVRQLKIGAILLAELLIIELLLGLVSYRTELDSRAVAHPLPGLAVMRATHAAIGALTLAAGLFSTFQSFKYLAGRAERL